MCVIQGIGYIYSAKLFKRSLSEKAFPALWKMTHVISSLQYLIIDRYLCYFRLIILVINEKIIFKHVYNYFHSNKLFYRYQAGFLPNHSTVHLFKTLRKVMYGIFCYLSKAFDRVCHSGLIFELQTYGIDGDLVLQSFLKSKGPKSNV